MPSPLDVLHEYYRVFSTLDVEGIVSYFCEPSLTIGPPGLSSAPTREALAASLAPSLASLRARGYGHSEFVDPQITMLGTSDVLVRGVAVRYTAAGPELGRVPLAYVMHRSSAGWKIAALVAEQ
jgi:hypothetical protein